MASNGAPGTPDLPDAVNKPPPGVVLPPKDIRTIVEKTAGYVARNGPAFEDRIRDKERQNPKFSFLNADDAYQPFYDWRLAEIKAGRGTAVSAGRATGETGAGAGAGAADAPEKPKGPEPPPEFYFSARMPNISAQDLDVVKLTALFVAKNGRSFMTALSQREARNYQFDFLRPQHSLHQFFSRLVDQYTDILQAPTVDGGRRHRQRMAELEENVRDRFHILEKAKKRSEWVRYQEQQKVQKEEEEEKERMEYAQIDWHDFVVVETVTFGDADDQVELPPPTSLNDLMNASLEQKAAMSLAPHNMRIEEAMPTDDMAPYAYPPAQQQQQQPQQYPQQQPPPSSNSPYNANGFAAPPPPSQPSYPGAPSPQGLPPGFSAPGTTFAQAANEDDARAIAERTAQREAAAAAARAAQQQQQQQQQTSGGSGAAPMRIRSDYVPRAQAKRAGAGTQMCPNCKQQIPIGEFEEHIKIELLDPHWKEQQERGQNRLASSHVPVMDASKNIRAASARMAAAAAAAVAPPAKREADLMGPPGVAGPGAVETPEEKRRRLEKREPPPGESVEDQLRRIQEKFGKNS